MPEVVIGSDKFEVPPLGGVAGLEAAQMLIPRIVEAREAFNKLAAVALTAEVTPEGETKLDQAGVRMALSSAGEVGTALLPLLAPDDFVRLTHLLTDVPEEALRRATLTELLGAAAVGLVNADLRGLLTASAAIYSEVLRGAKQAQPAETNGE
jgi:uncharacterized protein YjeT (DUF2065 family)